MAHFFYIGLCLMSLFVGKEVLGNLHGIEGCTFLYLVAYHPE